MSTFNQNIVPATWAADYIATCMPITGMRWFWLANPDKLRTRFSTAGCPVDKLDAAVDYALAFFAANPN